VVAQVLQPARAEIPRVSPPGSVQSGQLAERGAGVVRAEPGQLVGLPGRRQVVEYQGEHPRAGVDLGVPAAGGGDADHAGELLVEADLTFVERMRDAGFPAGRVPRRQLDDHAARSPRLHPVEIQPAPETVSDLALAGRDGR
jgi:hypothetical protein